MLTSAMERSSRSSSVGLQSTRGAARGGALDSHGCAEPKGSGAALDRSPEHGTRQRAAAGLADACGSNDREREEASGEVCEDRRLTTNAMEGSARRKVD